MLYWPQLRVLRVLSMDNSDNFITEHTHPDPLGYAKSRGATTGDGLPLSASEQELMVSELKGLIRTVARRAEGLRYCLAGVPSVDCQLDYLLSEARQAGRVADKFFGHLKSLERQADLMPRGFQDSEEISTDTTSEPSEESPGAETTVVVIDDDEQVLEVTSKTLEWLGYTVFAAGGGRDALERIEALEGPWSVALLDLLMPGMGGIEMYPILRRLRPDMKIVISSGYAAESFPQELRDAGFGGFLTKPYGPDELVEAIDTALGNTEKALNSAVLEK